MENLFDLGHQNLHLSEKIVAGLERLATLSRSLLWQEAQRQQLSPIQLQIMMFLQGHKHLAVTVSGLAAEFQLTKPTVSDAVKVLEQKEFILRTADAVDRRVQYITLSKTGRRIVMQSSAYLDPVVAAFDAQSAPELAAAWNVISGAIHTLVQEQTISPQRMCFTCRHYSRNGRVHHCALLDLVLHEAQIRLDCPEHEAA